MTCAVLITPLVDVVPIIEGCDYIGVDAGALKIIDQGLPIKMAVGDFDSLNEEDLKRITCPIERHPIMKDETDSELAIRLCKDYDTIYPIAARCGVFAKTDIQPLINEGATKPNLAASNFPGSRKPDNQWSCMW